MPSSGGALRRLVIAACVVLALLAGIAVVLLRTSGDDAPPPPELASKRYGFATDDGAAWAPEAGQLTMEKRGKTQQVGIRFRFRTADAIERLDDHGLELRLAVRTAGPCGGSPGWMGAESDGAAMSVDGLPKEAQPYLAVEVGRTCTETLVRIGALRPEQFSPGRDYAVTAQLPAGPEAATGATLTVARRSLVDCGDAPDVPANCVTGTVAPSGDDVEELVSAERGWAFDGTGCRRWYTDATTSFPCLPDQGARIMTLGDSITSGALGDHTWRYWAWQKLDPTTRPTWVGSKTETWTGDYAVPHTQWGSRHDSQAGVAASTVVGWVPDLMRSERPDLVMIDLGTNDTLAIQGSTAADTAANLDRIVAEVQEANPRAQILLGQPFGHREVAQPVMVELATRLTEVASARTTSDSLVSVVDLRSGWKQNLHTWDGTHPTQAGEFFIASRFVNQLAHSYAYGRVFGAVPGPPVPATPKDVKSLAQNGALLIAWERVPQTAEYRIYLRDATAGGEFELAGQGSRDVQWGRQGLTVGHEYEYYVTAVSSGRESPPSTIGSVKAV
ncbi:GDSL-type esterase/lipase family protein [Cryptosporangium sp. NPDC048952]|uniref:SGNH/GDSL hydrolase family protein n=1 Tax=Cryptosporangium sp. NPDC048952 TaxID=3363961 RepID=UPI003710FC13